MTRTLINVTAELKIEHPSRTWQQYLSLNLLFIIQVFALDWAKTITNTRNKFILSYHWVVMIGNYATSVSVCLIGNLAHDQPQG